MSNHDALTDTLLTGAIAVEAALYADAREVHGVYVDADLDHRKVEPVRRAAKAKRVELVRQSRAELDARVGHEKHGGVVAEVGPRQFVTLEDLLKYSGGERVFVAMLDGVEDPYNFGQAVRSLYAAGCHGVVVRPRNWAMADGEAPAIIARASAGTTELMPLAVAESPEAAADWFRQRHVPVVAAADHADAVPHTAADLAGPLLLVIGGEKRGIKKSLLAQADQVVAVPYARPFDHALGTVAAVSVLAFEVQRQRVAARPQPS